MADDEQPILPRAVDDPERLRQLREEAIAKLREGEEQRRDFEDRIQHERMPAPVYGGPPVRRSWWPWGK